MSLLLFFHIALVGFVAGLLIIADKEALSWFTGKRQTLEPERLRLYHKLTWAGLVSLGGTGFILVYPYRLYLLTEPLFIAKLFFVGVLFVNALLIGRLQHLATTHAFSSLSLSQKIPLFISGAASLYCWLGAAFLGYLVTNF